MTTKKNDGSKVTPISEQRKVTAAELRAARANLLSAQVAAWELISAALSGNPELEAAQDLLRTLGAPQLPQRAGTEDE